MAKLPARRRNRGEGTVNNNAGGFAVAPIECEDRRQVVDQSMEAHMQQILDSDLQDVLTDEQVAELVEQDRLSDNFGAMFNRIRSIKNQQNGDVISNNLLIEQQGDNSEQNQARGRGLAVNDRQGGHISAYDRDNGHQVGEKSWMQLRKLPSYMLTQLRGLGRQIFPQYTDTPLEDISLIGTLMHSQQTVENTIKWVTENGVQTDSSDIDFGENIQGYTAQTSLWEVDCLSFLIVRDNHGMYIYGWPEPERLKLDNAPQTAMIPKM